MVEKLGSLQRNNLSTQTLKGYTDLVSQMHFAATYTD